MDQVSFLWDGWQPLARILVVGTLAYLWLALLYHGNRPVEAALRRHRLTEADLHSAARENGRGTLDDVEAVILQADGTLAVIGSSGMGDGSSVRPFVRAPV